MTRFRTKYMWFWCSKDSSSLIVSIHRSFNNPWNVLIEIGCAESVEFDSTGIVKYFNVFESHKCTGSSWQQFISRYFSGKLYNKTHELYVYDSPSF